MDKLNRFVSNPFVILVTYILTLIGTLLGFSSNFVLQIIAVSIVALCIIIGVIVFIRFTCNVKKEKQKIEQEYSKRVKTEIDSVLQLVQKTVDHSLSIRQRQVDEEHFKSVCEGLCSAIRDVLVNISGIDFSVCIKQIITNELIELDFSEASTQTIARCGKDAVDRSKNDEIPQRISENTSFSEILEKCEFGWASADLKSTVQKYENEGKEYKNPDKLYKKYYNSTLVVPIRIKSTYMSPIIRQYNQNQNSSNYHCIAFLCADSSRTFDNNDEAFAKIAYRTLMVCGDALYPLFENKLVKEIENV